jgi:tRNA pseudouridine55 synthase
MKKIFIAGTFDILHPGHLNLIKQARVLGNFLIAVIARDQNVSKTKGRLPYYSETERVNNLEKLGLVDKVVLGDLNNPYKTIGEEKPDIIALGYDQKVFIEGLPKNLTVKKLQPFKEDFCKGKNLRKAFEDEASGFLLINKEEDWTSHDAVAKLRSVIGIRQIGHTGTLDPFATGLLICALGSATKMVGLFDLLSKEYEAEIKLGEISDTYDRTGEIRKPKSEIRNPKQIPMTEIQNVLKSFIGRQKQLPPMYSAKKVAGKKLYELARQGKEIERKPSEIEIYDIELLGDERRATKDVIHHSSFTIRVKCSTGTYIRTLAHDLGEKLGCGAILQELKRTAIGDFKLTESVNLSQLAKENHFEFLIKPAEALLRINRQFIKDNF